MSTIAIGVVPKPYYRGYKVLDGVTYALTFRWNTTSAKWYMDLDSKDVSIKGIALMTGKNLLARYGHAQLGQLWVIDNSNQNANPNYNDFGSRFTLEYITVA